MILLLVQWLYMPITENLLNILVHQIGNSVRLVSISTFGRMNQRGKLCGFCKCRDALSALLPTGYPLRYAGEIE